MKIVKCARCWAKIVYKAWSNEIICEYCQHKQTIKNNEWPIKEYYLEDHLFKSELFEKEITITQCSNCWAQIELESTVKLTNCKFCWEPHKNKKKSIRSIIPESVLPFQIKLEEAKKKYKLWLKKLWFAPNDLKRWRLLNDIEWYYVPYFVYDSNADIDFSADIWHYYYVSKQINWKSYSVRKVRRSKQNWSFSHYFDNIPISSSTFVHHSIVKNIEPYNRNQLKVFNVNYISWWNTLIYDINLNDWFELFKERNKSDIRSMCVSKLKWDTFRFLRFSSKYYDKKFKHTLLPVYISTMKYNNKLYRIYINGQTWKVSWERPISKTKIIFLLIIIFIITLLIVIIFLN